MGEVGVSGEEGMELEVLQEAYSENGKDDGAMVRWERFLPRMALRVLLVEADDSTRQIIAALLKKCSYKVAAVSDGLKAWEVLKRRPHSIDLILTEVELPSISGFALLTLTMEHEICKNIPVIMMSSHDSISTVYNCMLRGAADFLVKPIRRNELRNLWQHVWRRQSSTIGKSDPQDESVAQRKVEATAENNGASNHSSGYKACSQINKECIVMGSNSQSSCTKPEMEAESTYVENMQDFSHPKWSRSGQELLIQENEASGPAVASIKQGNRVFWEKDVEQERDMEDPNVTGKACGNNDSLFRSCKEAIDLIGAFDSNPQFSCRMSGSDVVQNKFDTFPQLDLSLRRSDPCGSENQITDEKQTLNHSNASAFSRYINRGSLPLCPEPSSICSQDKENGINSEKNLHTHAPAYNSDASCLTLNAQRSVSSMPTGHFRQAEATISCSQERVVPINVPVRGINFDSFSAGFGTVRPPVQSGPSPIQSETSDSKQIFESIPNPNNLNSQSRYKENDKLESSDDRGHFSTTTDQSDSGRFCNGTANHLNSIGSGSICGSNGTSSNPVAGVRTGSEGANEEGLSTFDGNSHRSTQREAALNKFRLKRKDRCFEKKVRYESRKKLAEQRPRVKGQFVRQAQVDPLTAGG